MITACSLRVYGAALACELGEVDTTQHALFTRVGSVRLTLHPPLRSPGPQSMKVMV